MTRLIRAINRRRNRLPNSRKRSNVSNNSRRNSDEPFIYAT